LSWNQLHSKHPASGSTSAIGFIANNRIASGLRTSDEVKYRAALLLVQIPKSSQLHVLPVGRENSAIVSGRLPSGRLLARKSHAMEVRVLQLGRRLGCPAGLGIAKHGLFQLRVHFICDGYYVAQHFAEIHSVQVIL